MSGQRSLLTKNRRESRQQPDSGGHEGMMAEVPPTQAKRFEALYRQNWSHVMAYCLRRAGSVDAPDVCSETFLVAWRRFDDIPPPPETLPYLYGIAGRVLSTQLRALRRRSRLDNKLRNLGVAPPVEPSTLVFQSTRDQEVIAAVNRLKAKDREIIMLYTWEDLPRETIAQMMGMTRSAVDQRIHRSYQHLARILEPVMESRAINPPPIAKEGGT
jgi:RNA polymerase sigma-70 factor (ECF subfamily)